MGFMSPGGEFCESGNSSHWLDQKQPSFPIPMCSYNTKWETTAVCMSVYEKSVIKATGRVNASLQCWGFTNSPRYHADRFHTYRNFPTQYVPGRRGTHKSFNAIVWPTQFINIREQVFPGYPIWKRSDVFNHNALHVCIAQGLDIPIL